MTDCVTKTMCCTRRRPVIIDSEQYNDRERTTSATIFVAAVVVVVFVPSCLQLSRDNRDDDGSTDSSVGRTVPVSLGPIRRPGLARAGLPRRRGVRSAIRLSSSDGASPTTRNVILRRPSPHVGRLRPRYSHGILSLVAVPAPPTPPLAFS